MGPGTERASRLEHVRVSRVEDLHDSVGARPVGGAPCRRGDDTLPEEEEEEEEEENRSDLAPKETVVTARP